MITNPKSYTNAHLMRAAVNKQDEFYTSRVDIEAEMATYTSYNPDVFAGKVILLPCDDPDRSQFTAFFLDNFKTYCAKAVVSTCYNKAGKGKYLIHTAKTHLTGELQGNGDFNSREIRKLRGKADVIITNPPFSLFPEFIAWVLESGKSYSVVGNLLAVACQYVFPHIKSGAMRIGLSKRGGGTWFEIPAEYPVTACASRTDAQGRRQVCLGNICWYTNIPAEPYTRNILLTKTYDPEAYPRFDNYDAINVNRVCDIPKDYDGVMGVPLNFINKYNPQQFEIIGSSKWLGQDPSGVYGRQARLYGKEVFVRLFVRRRGVSSVR